MLSSGPKSYYDDYVRKKGSGRLMHDPPSLLTDRGAYVNFLEVQLERVSAACLGVQGYDQRFNDMQNLLVNVEEKSNATMRLVSLAQECSERIREETDEKVSKITNYVSDEHKQMLKMFQIMSERITSMEQSLTTLYGIFPRMESIEHRMESYESSMKILDSKTQEGFSAVKADIDNNLTQIESLKNRSNDFETKLSKHLFEQQEFEKKLMNLIGGLEDRTKEMISHHKDDTFQRVSGISNKVDFDINRLEKVVNSNEVEMRETIKRQGDYLIEELSTVEREFNENIADKMKTMEISMQETLLTYGKETHERLNSIDDYLDEVHNRRVIFENEIIQQFESFDSHLCETNDKFESMESNTNQLIAINENFMKSIQQDLQQYQQQLSENTAMTKQLSEQNNAIFGENVTNFEGFQAMLTAKVNELVSNQVQQQLVQQQQWSEPSGDMGSVQNTGNVRGPSVPLQSRSNVTPQDLQMKELFGRFLDAYQLEQQQLRSRIEEIANQKDSNTQRTTQVSGQQQQQMSQPQRPQQVQMPMFQSADQQEQQSHLQRPQAYFNQMRLKQPRQQQSSMENGDNINNQPATMADQTPRKSRYLLPYFSRVPPPPPWLPNNTSLSGKSNDPISSGNIGGSWPLSVPPLTRDKSPDITRTQRQSYDSEGRRSSNNDGDRNSDTSSVVSRSTTVNNNNDSCESRERLRRQYRHRDHLVGAAAKISQSH